MPPLDNRDVAASGGDSSQGTCDRAGDERGDIERIVRALRARTEIEDVLRRLCAGADRNDYEMVRSAYHDGAYDDHGSYRGDVDGLIEWAGRRHAVIDQSMHFLGNCTIELYGARAFVETYCIVHQRIRGDGSTPATRMTVGCRFVDLFEFRKGEWRIARHVVVYEWWREHPCEDERELDPAWAHALRSRGDLRYRMSELARGSALNSTGPNG